MDPNKTDVPKRRRGRPRKEQLIVYEFPTAHLHENQMKELHFGYKLLKDILKTHKVNSIVDKPDDSLFGYHDYYSVIKKPMWIKEVSRKYADGEYTALVDVICDVKLTLENFHNFWGRNKMLINQANRVEKILQDHITELPEHLKSLCFAKPDMNLESENEESSEIAKWEEVLKNKEKTEQIHINSDLAEIGNFLRLAGESLCLKEVTQYEIERMLFIVKESTTLATIMTSLLCPSNLRSSLYFKPIMTYEVWNSLLFRKMELWYRRFKKRDRLEMFSYYGIETRFWDVVGESNPMKERKFDELPFVIKACILNTLCVWRFHTCKKIKVDFNTVKRDSLRKPLLYEDSKYQYMSLFSPEIRVYRYPNENWNVDQWVTANVADLKIEAASEPDAPEEMNSQRSMFALIASDKESLVSFMESINENEKSFNAITSLINNDQTDICAKKGLKNMFDQWKNFDKRSASHATNSFDYWIEKYTYLQEQKIVNCLQNAEAVKGERVSKQELSLEDIDSSSNDERMSEENLSDWEDDKSRQFRKMK